MIIQAVLRNISRKFLMTPDSENTGSGVSICFKWQEKHTQEKKSSLPSRTTLSSNDILDWFKCIKKRKGEKLQDQENVNLTGDNLFFLLICL